MAVRAAKVAATILGCLLDRAGRRSSTTGAATSSSIYSKIASRAEAFVAALVDERPFSTREMITFDRVLIRLLKNTTEALRHYLTSYILRDLQTLEMHITQQYLLAVLQRLSLLPLPSTAQSLV